MEGVQKIVVSGLLQHSGKVLLIRRSQREKFYPGHFELPGGKVDFGENPVKALEREFLEETNLKIAVENPLRTFSYVSEGGQRHSVEIVFRVFLVSNPSEIQLSADHDEYRWALPSRIDELKLSEEIRKSFDYVQ
jgi:8-oxo-dGTP diphosphatase